MQKEKLGRGEKIVILGLGRNPAKKGLPKITSKKQEKGRVTKVSGRWFEIGQPKGPEIQNKKED